MTDVLDTLLDHSCEFYDEPGQDCITAGPEVLIAEGCGPCVARFALRDIADGLDDLLQSFITTESGNPPEWDRAQSRIVAYLQRQLRERARH